ncbi:MAG: hypothetical protein AB1758_20580, partial [Candidatus Eremiobacterota bacterium]
MPKFLIDTHILLGFVTRFRALTLFLLAFLALQSACFSAPPDGPDNSVRALVLVDKRLYDRIRGDLNAYVRAASERRRIPIRVVPLVGIDDWQPPRVLQEVRQLRKRHPRLEGILYVGNIQLPTFFMPRPDQPSTRLWPRYLEDLDMVAQKRLKPGTLIQGIRNGQPAPAD